MLTQLRHKIDDNFSIVLGEDESKLVATTRLTKDLRQAAASLSEAEARYYVDMYYNLQKLRIAAAGQIRQAREVGEPSSLLQWTFMLYDRLEQDVKDTLEVYARTSTVGRWALSILGIGPVLSAGLMAHIDITKAPSAGHIWRYAGLDPTAKWERKQKRPWNAELKVICWKIGQSFVKVSSNERDYYGKLYRKRKAYELQQNEAGAFAEQAKRALSEKNYGKDTEAYAAYSRGRLPPAHIEQRAERWTVKIFLSHFWAVAYETHYKVKPPRPYAITYLGHVDEIVIPNWPMKED